MWSIFCFGSLGWEWWPYRYGYCLTNNCIYKASERIESIISSELISFSESEASWRWSDFSDVAELGKNRRGCSERYLYFSIITLQINTMGGKKALLFAALTKKTFLTQLIFGGGQMNDNFIKCITRSIYILVYYVRYYVIYYEMFKMRLNITIYWLFKRSFLGQID